MWPQYNFFLHQVKIFGFNLQYLCVPIKGSVVQGGASPAIWNIDAAQERDDDLSTAQGLVGGSDMQRSLPVLIPCVNIGRMTDQHANGLLENKTTNYIVYFRPAGIQLTNQHPVLEKSNYNHTGAATYD